MTLEFTGERFLTECQGEMVYEHWHRYLLARDYAAGKRVLDVASGEGYGSHLLASVAESVVGVDLSADAVAHASQKYDKENLRYVAASCTQIPLPDASFDFIVSFETIEHIDESAQRAFLAEVNRLLKPDGLFLISSPNRPEYSDKTGYKNEFHVKELDKVELQEQLERYWPHSFWAAQRAAFHSMIWPIDLVAQEATALSNEGNTAFPEPMYFLVFCSKRKETVAAVRPALTLVADQTNSVYAEWSRTYRENAALVAENAELRTASRSSPSLVTSRATTTAIDSCHSKDHWLVRLARQLTR